MIQGWVEPVSGWSAFAGLVILVVVSLVRGWLVPKSTHVRELQASDKRGDEWKETALEGRKTINSLIQTNKIVDDFFRKVTVREKDEDSVT